MMKREPVIVIAEAGVNHNGDLDLAKQLVREAAKAGVDYVKFQTFKAEKLVTRSAAKAAYQVQNTGVTESQFEMLKKLELSIDDHHALVQTCKEHGIKFLSTAFDLESLDFLEGLGIDLFKIPSGEITNYPYLKKISTFGRPVVLSTGMSDLNDIKDAIAVLERGGIARDLITVLHCNTEYPTPMIDVNLLAMQAIARELGVRVGYSDHTLGIEVPVAAVALGAVCIEKHFTMDRSLPGPDHVASLEPTDLALMVRSIRNIELALGSDRKAPSQSEGKNRDVARKSIVAARAIRKGERFSDENLTTKRPGNGLNPMRWEEILQLTATRDFAEDEQISLE